MRSWLEHSAFAEVLLGGRGKWRAQGEFVGDRVEAMQRAPLVGALCYGRRQADGVRPGYGRRRRGRRCRLVRRYGGGRRCPERLPVCVSC